MAYFKTYRLKLWIKNRKSVIRQILLYTGLFTVVLFSLKCLLTGSVLFSGPYPFNFETGPTDTGANVQIANSSENDERLWKLIRKQHLVSPTPRNVPYKLEHPENLDFSQLSQSTMVINLMNNLTNGFFIECGAYDGESLSNSLMLERNHGWTGLLIEPSPENFAKMQAKNRKAWLFNGCLEGSNHARKMSFFSADLYGVLEKDVGDKKAEERILGLQKTNSIDSGTKDVWCFPLWALLRAIDDRHLPRIDYFSLDVEGSEMSILQSLPWEKLNFGIIQVEYHVGSGKTNSEEIREFMAKRVPGLVEFGDNTLDLIFMNKSLIP